MKLHRAATLVVLLLLSVLMLAGSLTYAATTFSAQSLVPLGVVVIAAALAGVAFSWRRYRPRRR